MFKMFQWVRGRTANTRHIARFAHWLRKYPRYSTPSPWKQMKTKVNLVSHRLRQGRFADSVARPRLSPQMVSFALRMHEQHVVVEQNGPISSFAINEFPANQPTEDRSLQGQLLNRDWLFGVIDGHGGWVCAQAVRDRLLSYVAVGLADSETLRNITEGKIDPTQDLGHFHGECCHTFSNNMEELHRRNLINFATQRLSMPEGANSMTIEKALTDSFLSLDHAIVSNALPGSEQDLKNDKSCLLDCLKIALAGAVSVVAYISNKDLFVANVGDAQAVLGRYKDDQWTALPLSQNHNACNAEEVERITKNHPNESRNIIKHGRLFGELMPLRAFGDARYKFLKEDLGRLSNVENIWEDQMDFSGERLVPNKYFTPPYLDAEPEVMHHTLTPEDKFLILASDGLWDCSSPDEVVKLVAGHMDSQQVLVHYTPTEGSTLKNVQGDVGQRKGGFENPALDSNVATHLLRNALGPDHGQVSAKLTVPESLVRHYRDDITITVVCFNSSYLKESTVPHQL